jgi:DNA-binding PadR family transcriptional regulator
LLNTPIKTENRGIHTAGAFLLGQKPGIAPVIIQESSNMLLLSLHAGLKCERRVKDAVVGVLSQDWPLSLKQIYFTISRNYPMAVSQQAVYKALKQLVENKVLVKKERKYALSIDWIRSLKELGIRLEEEYCLQEPESTIWLKEIQPKDYNSTKIEIA